MFRQTISTVLYFCSIDILFNYHCIKPLTNVASGKQQKVVICMLHACEELKTSQIIIALYFSICIYQGMEVNKEGNEETMISRKLDVAFTKLALFTSVYDSVVKLYTNVTLDSNGQKQRQK